MRQPEAVCRLRSAEGHLRGIIAMIENGASCQDIIHQVLAVRGALDGINRLLLQHYLHDCLHAQLTSCDPAVREQALAHVIALYRLIGGGTPVSLRKES